MSEWKEIFQFSRAETFALAILLLMILIGGGILLYQNSTQTLPPELFFQSAGAATTQPNTSAPILQSNPKPTDQPQAASSALAKKPAKPTSLMLNINTAPAESLMMLPRVGNVVGQRIIDLRQRLGRFDSVEQLVQVRGIGKKTLELIRPNIMVGDIGPGTDKSDSVSSRK
jgi:competence ComEA-like helix-hairpin-helix protein